MSHVEAVEYGARVTQRPVTRFENVGVVSTGQWEYYRIAKEEVDIHLLCE